jgi:hypothetical protein
MANGFVSSVLVPGPRAAVVAMRTPVSENAERACTVAFLFVLFVEKTCAFPPVPSADQERATVAENCTGTPAAKKVVETEADI